MIIHPVPVCSTPLHNQVFELCLRSAFWNIHTRGPNKINWQCTNFQVFSEIQDIDLLSSSPHGDIYMCRSINRYFQKSSQRGYITSQTTPIFDPWTYYETFWHFWNQIYIISTAFLGSKNEQKEENMMSCTRLYVEHRAYRDTDGPRKENSPSEEPTKLLVLLSGYLSPKLSVFITTDQLARSGLMIMETDSLGGWELENDTNNFGRSYL